MMAEIVTMPKLGFDMAEGTLARWVIQEGESVSKGDILAEIETDKATVEVESTYEGIVAQHLVSTGEIVPINTPIAVVAAPGEKVERKTLEEISGKEEISSAIKPISSPIPQETEITAAVPTIKEAPPTGQLPEGVRATPLARRMASNMGINLRDVKGSGPSGRILKRDLKSFIEAPAVDVARPPAPISSAYPVASPLEYTAPATQSKPIPRLRAAIGRRMTEAKQQIPHFYVTHEYNVEELLALRKKFNNLFPEEEKVSVNDFILKAVALTLRQFPNLNSSFQGDQIIRHGPINIGVAVAVEGGLLTVVCRDTDQKPIQQIASEVRVMAKKARDGKVRPEDIEGSTFSVSNLGMFEVEHFIAIINPPEAAILAVGSAREVPIARDGHLQAGWRMKATISVDHRVSDGAEAARFLQALAVYLEEPLQLLVKY